MYPIPFHTSMKHRSSLLFPLAIAAGLALAFVFVPGAIPSLRGDLMHTPMMLRAEESAVSALLPVSERCTGEIRGEDYQMCCVDMFVGQACCDYAREKQLPPPPACAERCMGDIRAEDYKMCCVDMFAGQQCCDLARDKGEPLPAACMQNGGGGQDRCAGEIRGEDYQVCCVDKFAGRQCCDYAQEKGLPPPDDCAMPAAMPDESGMQIAY